MNTAYQGGAFSDTLPKGKAGGDLLVEGGCLIFQREGLELKLPLAGVEVKRGGAANRVLFFTHSSCPGVTLHTPDRSILEELALRDNPSVAEIKKSISSGKRGWVIGGVLGLLVIAFCCYAVWASQDVMVRSVAEVVPIEWEVKLGEIAFEQVKGEGKIIEDPEIQKELDAFVAPLLESVKQSGVKDYPFRFYLVENQELNAFAIPGGYVVLHSGLLLEAEKAEEVLGVVAHEIAHVTEQHSIRQIIRSAGLLVIVQALIGDMQGISALILANGEYLLKQKFSRDFERDADDVGWRYLVQANIDPRGMIAFFEKLQAHSKESGTHHLEQTLEFLSTHPDTEERIVRLEKKWDQEFKNKEKSNFKKLNLNFEHFQNRVRTLVNQSEAVDKK